jgi:hypothetical protein
MKTMKVLNMDKQESAFGQVKFYICKSRVLIMDHESSKHG